MPRGSQELWRADGRPGPAGRRRGRRHPWIQPLDRHVLQATGTCLETWVLVRRELTRYHDRGLVVLWHCSYQVWYRCVEGNVSPPFPNIRSIQRFFLTIRSNSVVVVRHSGRHHLHVGNCDVLGSPRHAWKREIPVKRPEDPRGRTSAQQSDGGQEQHLPVVSISRGTARPSDLAALPLPHLRFRL